MNWYFAHLFGGGYLEGLGRLSRLYIDFRANEYCGWPLADGTVVDVLMVCGLTGFDHLWGHGSKIVIFIYSMFFFLSEMLGSRKHRQI